MLEVRPAWDPTGHVAIRLRSEQRELEVITDAAPLGAPPRTARRRCLQRHRQLVDRLAEPRPETKAA